MTRTIDEILMPGGQPLGVKGTGPRATAKIREVPGGDAEAQAMFEELTEGGTDVTPRGYAGEFLEHPQLLGHRGFIGYRPASKSGPPTIDVKAVDSSGQPIPIEKVKFVG